MIRITEGTIVTLVLLAFAALVFCMTLGLGPVARVVPLRVAIVTLALIVFQLMLDVLPLLAQKIQVHVKEQADPSKTRLREGVVKSPVRSSSHQSTARFPARKRELKAFLWLLGIPTAICLFGFLMAVPLYTFLFLKVQSRAGYPVSIVAPAGLFCLLYGIFHILLGIRLEVGLFWRILG